MGTAGDAVVSGPENFMDIVRRTGIAAGLGEDLDRESQGVTDLGVIRNNCAFCGRERSRKDDNHAPDCPYWGFFDAGPGDGS